MANRGVFYQKGHLFTRGKRRKLWVGRWREPVIEGGQLVSVHRSAVLGPAAVFTKKQAQQELDKLLAESISPATTRARRPHLLLSPLINGKPTSSRNSSPPPGPQTIATSRSTCFPRSGA